MLLGDVNLDGEVTFADIRSFITILSTAGIQAEADTNLDGEANFLDIQAFVDILPVSKRIQYDGSEKE